jgi:hypothetical protein
MNKLNINLEEKYVIAYGDVWFCDGGFGCCAATMGRAIFAKNLRTGKTERIESGIERLATEKEVSEKKKLLPIDDAEKRSQ